MLNKPSEGTRTERIPETDQSDPGNGRIGKQIKAE